MYICICICLLAYVCMHVSAHACICVNMWIYVCEYVCTHGFVYIHVGICAHGVYVLTCMYMWVDRDV